MLIHVRPIAATLAVIAFFGLNFVCMFYGLSPLTCCKRAFIGAVLIYLATAVTVNIVNAVLTRAIIESHVNKGKGT
jgi:hypothetical protein